MMADDYLLLVLDYKIWRPRLRQRRRTMDGNGLHDDDHAKDDDDDNDELAKKGKLFPTAPPDVRCLHDFFSFDRFSFVLAPSISHPSISKHFLFIHFSHLPPLSRNITASFSCHRIHSHQLRSQKKEKNLSFHKYRKPQFNFAHFCCHRLLLFMILFLLWFKCLAVYQQLHPVIAAAAVPAVVVVVVAFVDVLRATSNQIQ